MFVWKYITTVSSGNKGCHESQVDEIKLWLASYPTFPYSYGISRLPEEGKCRSIAGTVRDSPVLRATLL